MKIKLITLAIACIAFTACNSNSKENNLEDSIVTDSSSLNPGNADMETMDSTGVVSDTTGLNNGTTYPDSIQ